MTATNHIPSLSIIYLIAYSLNFEKYITFYPYTIKLMNKNI